MAFRTPPIPEYRCSNCKGKVEVRPVPAAQGHADDGSPIIIAKTMPVLICPRCDDAPTRRKDTLHPPR